MTEGLSWVACSPWACHQDKECLWQFLKNHAGEIWVILGPAEGCLVGCQQQEVEREQHILRGWCSSTRWPPEERCLSLGPGNCRAGVPGGGKLQKKESANPRDCEATQPSKSILLLYFSALLLQREEVGSEEGADTDLQGQAVSTNYKP